MIKEKYQDVASKAKQIRAQILKLKIKLTNRNAKTNNVF
jgi:hypothetical protein